MKQTYLGNVIRYSKNYINKIQIAEFEAKQISLTNRVKDKIKSIWK